MTPAVGDVCYRVPKSLPPYTRAVPHEGLRAWPGHERALVIEADVVGALIELPRLDACGPAPDGSRGPDYRGLAVEVGTRGEVTLWRCEGHTRRRVWRVKTW